MNCFDCATSGHSHEAIAVCADCGAGLCIEHTQVVPRWLARTMAINRPVTVQPAARTIYCNTCRTAHSACGDLPSPDHAAPGP